MLAPMLALLDRCSDHIYMYASRSAAMELAAELPAAELLAAWPPSSPSPHSSSLTDPFGAIAKPARWWGKKHDADPLMLRIGSTKKSHMLL